MDNWTPLCSALPSLCVAAIGMCLCRYYNRLLFRPPVDHSLEARLKEASAAHLACKNSRKSRSSGSSNRDTLEVANDLSNRRLGGLFWESSTAALMEEEDAAAASGWGACAAANTTKSPFVMLSETFNGQEIEAQYLAKANPSATRAATQRTTSAGAGLPNEALGGGDDESTEAVRNGQMLLSS